MSKKKAGIEETLVAAISNGTVEQATTIQKFVNALVNNKVNGSAAAVPAKTRSKVIKTTSIGESAPAQAAAA